VRPSLWEAMPAARVLLILLALAAGAGPAAAQAPPPKLPQPTYPATVSEEVLIGMDDGVKIAATITLPSQDGATPAAGRFPVVLGMTPYGRNGVCSCPSGAVYAARGIAVAVADVRGTGGSGGDLSGNYFSPREARDGYQLVEYLGTQPWSTGKVGMAGGSYVGITQYLTAEQQPPHLAAITPIVAISDLYRDGYAHGGIPNIFFDAQYIGVQGGPGYASANNDPLLLEETLRAKAGQSPPGLIAFDYLSRPNDDQFYRDRSPIYHAERITVPVLDIGGWQDGLLRGATEMYEVLSRRPGVETRLYMDPCTHKGCGAPFAPTTNPPGRLDTQALVFEFLDQHLRGAAVPERPRVEFYVQGRNAYASDTRWPPTGTRYERLALGDGTLGGAPGAGAASYVSDPAAGFALAFNRYGTVAASPYVPLDQRLEGPHGLTFRTPALDRPRLLAGPLALHLSAASTATDTDFYAKVSDVAPDGTESVVTEGALRASHRAIDPAKSRPERPYHPHTDPQPVEPGRFYDYAIEIWPTAYELAPGHRLQLRITSTDLPTHLPGSYHVDRAAPQDTRVDLQAPATNTIRFADSYLVVPVAGSAEGVPAAAPARSCRRPAARRVRLRAGRSVLRVTVTRGGQPVNGASVTVAGRRVRTGRSGRAVVTVRRTQAGRVAVATRACGARFAVVARSRSM
jgi:putative CocE/NonD family hydrolase